MQRYAGWNHTVNRSKPLSLFNSTPYSKHNSPTQQVRSMPRMFAICTAFALVLAHDLPAALSAEVSVPEPKALNNLVALLWDEAPDAAGGSFPFVRPSDGWIFISVTTHGDGTIRLMLDKGAPGETPVDPAPGSGPTQEAMHYVAKGRHILNIERTGTISLEHLTVKAIPELIHSGLGYNPQIKSYGLYDMAFLKRDILPNVTTLIVPGNSTLSNSIIEDWHRQGKRFIAEVWVNPQAKTADEHATYWTSFFRNSPFIDGIIIDEFIVNRPVSEWVETMTADRLARMKKESADYELYSQAFQKIRADSQFAEQIHLRLRRGQWQEAQPGNHRHQRHPNPRQLRLLRFPRALPARNVHRKRLP